LFVHRTGETQSSIRSVHQQWQIAQVLSLNRPNARADAPKCPRRLTQVPSLVHPSLRRVGTPTQAASVPASRGARAKPIHYTTVGAAHTIRCRPRRPREMHRATTAPHRTALHPHQYAMKAANSRNLQSPMCSMVMNAADITPPSPVPSPSTQSCVCSQVMAGVTQAMTTSPRRRDPSCACFSAVT